jgi:uncharacterized protein
VSDSPEGSFAYLDSSAIVKLIVEEAESPALRSCLARWGTSRYTSVVSRLEVIRAVRRGAPSLEAAARRILARCLLAPLSEAIVRRAERAGDPHLSSLDAIQVATAQTLELDLFVAYDRRLLASARAAGIRVESPGAAQA